MKKIIALFTAVMFAMTLGVAFAQEKAAAPAPTEKKAEDTKKADKKAKKDKKKADKKAKKDKKVAEEKKAAAPAAAPAAK
jgi:hypothetical protein